MKLLTFHAGNELRLGLSTTRGVIDLAAAADDLGLAETPRTADELFARGLDALGDLAHFEELAAQRDGTWLIGEQGLKLGPCVPAPGKILCVGLNYLRHAKESGMAVPQTPVLFSKFNNSLAAHGQDVELPAAAVEYDYEAELVVVMGKRARDVSEEDALSYVLGYCNGNDLSARDLQMLTGQWLVGKTLDGFMPVGPYLLTADEAGNPQEWPVRCWLNGELRQDSSTADMIFSVAQVISYASRYMTLEPGDLISTGTPEGVVLGMKEKVWLKPGDRVVVEVGDLGRLENQLVAPGTTMAGRDLWRSSAAKASG